MILRMGAASKSLRRISQGARGVTCSRFNRPPAKQLASWRPSLPCSPPSHDQRSQSPPSRRQMRWRTRRRTQTRSSPGSHTREDGAGEGIVVADRRSTYPRRAGPSNPPPRRHRRKGGGARTCGSRRFALAPLGADRPLAQVRAALTDQGWTGDTPITVISDGEAALPELVRRATQSRRRPHPRLVARLDARAPCRTGARRRVCAWRRPHHAGLDMVEYRLSRIRHLLWNGYHGEARRELFGLQHLAREAVYLNGDRLRPAVGRFLARCEELRGCSSPTTTDGAGRLQPPLPLRPSRSPPRGPKGCVDEIANARMAKRRRMRWSPRGANRVQAGRQARRADHHLTTRTTNSRLTAQAFATPFHLP